MTSSVHIEAVEKLYGDVRALKGISVQVNQGEFVTLLGPSGCGKTTLLRCIAGLETIQGGEIRIGSQVVSSPNLNLEPDKRNLGFVFQSYALWPHMTVAENVAFPLKVAKVPEDETMERVREVLALVDMEALGARYPSELSGGQQQRVAVARSISTSPSVLLFDEPLSNLDAKLRERMRYELREVQQSLGTTALYVTHDQEEAMSISDRVVLMDVGEVVQEGTPMELYDHPRTTFAAGFLGVGNFINGVVEGSTKSSEAASVRIGEDTVVRVDLPEHMRGVDDLVLCIRPHDLRLSTDRGRLELLSENSVALEATVHRVVYTGGAYEVFVDLLIGVRVRVLVRGVGAATGVDVNGLVRGDRILVGLDTKDMIPVVPDKMADEDPDARVQEGIEEVRGLADELPLGVSTIDPGSG